MNSLSDKCHPRIFSLAKETRNTRYPWLDQGYWRVGLMTLLLLTTGISQATQDSANPGPDQATDPVSQIDLEKNLDRQRLHQEIDAQFERIRLGKENGSAFNLELGDEYLNYATLLSQAGFFDDANSAYQRAAHIQKTNHGIDSAQQLPALEGLFNNKFAVGDINDAEKYLDDVARVEQKNPSLRDKSSVLMRLKMGHYYLEKLKNISKTNELGQRYLKSANKYFLAVIEQNESKKLKGSLFPYGELAMTSYLGDQLQRRPDKVFTSNLVRTPANLLKEIRGHGTSTTTAELAPIEDILYNEELDQALPRALSMLKYYFKKADAEGNVEEALKATLALGDLNFLSGRTQRAKDYYAYAWATSQLLAENHPDRLALEQPAQLPNFKYAYNPVVNQEQFDDQNASEVLAMPLEFDVNKRGAIKNIKSLVDAERKLVSKAKRELRKYPFRPAIKQGRLSDSQDFVQAVAVEIK